ncbi:hypothetical protein [Cellulomonas endophytica]|uniref:hypothetical protein n=1 Tax=Cellulomonas endophytica TaxID=2494735 RepID=UPI0010139B03|nr:hypothetical protein [Cellulomonas endophytica]
MDDEDQRAAAALARAREAVLGAGARELGRRPWQAPGQPPADLDLVRHAAWVAREPSAPTDVVLAGLRLLAAARAELDGVEAALLFAARADGVTFQALGEALGLGSGQAAQQRMARVVARLDAQG